MFFNIVNNASSIIISQLERVSFADILSQSAGHFEKKDEANWNNSLFFFVFFVKDPNSLPDHPFDC